MFKRVFIVREGSWGQVTDEEYGEQVEMYKDILAGVKDNYGNEEAVVEVIETIAEAERRVSLEADKVVFISRGAEQAAERIAKANPHVRVVIFSGLIPDGKVVWAHKISTANPKMITNIVLYW